MSFTASQLKTTLLLFGALCLTLGCCQQEDIISEDFQTPALDSAEYEWPQLVEADPQLIQADASYRRRRRRRGRSNSYNGIRNQGSRVHRYSERDEKRINGLRRNAYARLKKCRKSCRGIRMWHQCGRDCDQIYRNENRGVNAGARLISNENKYKYQYKEMMHKSRKKKQAKAIYRARETKIKEAQAKTRFKQEKANKESMHKIKEKQQKIRERRRKMELRQKRDKFMTYQRKLAAAAGGLPLKNAGADCSRACRGSGACSFCGYGGTCCKYGVKRNGCDGRGVNGLGHICTAKPKSAARCAKPSDDVPKHIGVDCWGKCRKNGQCNFCGSGFCCRLGIKKGGCDGKLGVGNHGVELDQRPSPTEPMLTQSSAADTTQSGWWGRRRQHRHHSHHRHHRHTARHVCVHRPKFAMTPEKKCKGAYKKLSGKQERSKKWEMRKHKSLTSRKIKDELIVKKANLNVQWMRSRCEGWRRPSYCVYVKGILRIRHWYPQLKKWGYTSASSIEMKKRFPKMVAACKKDKHCNKARQRQKILVKESYQKHKTYARSLGRATQIKK